MADNYEGGNGENADEFNSSSFLDNSLGAKYEVCTGPVSDGEKAYLLRHGLALEDSRGELYGEPSTIIDFEDSLVADEPEQLALSPKNTPTPAGNKSNNVNQELRRSSRKSRATTPCIKCKLDSTSTPRVPTPMGGIERQMSQLALQDKENVIHKCSEEDKVIVKTADPINSPATPAYKSTPKRGSKRFNTDSTPVPNQSCRVTRGSVKRNTELMLLTSLNVQDQIDEGINNDHKEDNDVEHAESECIENKISGQDTESEVAMITEPTAASTSPIPESALEKDETTSPSAMREDHQNSSEQEKDVSKANIGSERFSNNKNKSMNFGNQISEAGNNASAAVEEVTEAENPIVAEEQFDDNATIPQNQDQEESKAETDQSAKCDEEANKANNTDSDLQNVSSVLFNDSTYSISSGDEFDDTITRTEKILAMADAQEKTDVEIGSLVEALAEKKTEEIVQSQMLSTTKSPRAVAKKLSMTAARESIGPSQQTRPPILPVLDRRSGIATATPTGRTPSPLFRAPIPTLTGSGKAAGIKKITPLTSRIQTGITPTSANVTPLRPKTFGSGSGIKRAFFASPSPTPAPAPVPIRSATKTASPFPAAGTGTPGSERNLFAKSVKSTTRKDDTTDAVFKTPELSPFLRGKKESYFKSPATGLRSPHKERADAPHASMSTPILPFTKPRPIQDTIVSPVSTIYPSPVARKTPIPIKPVLPIPIQIAKITKERPASPLALLKKNYKTVSSPVAEYIYSTPNPIKIQRVVKTSDNSSEKKPPFRAGGVSSLPRRSGIPRLTAMTATFSGAGSGNCGFSATKVLRESLQNQQQPNPNDQSPAAQALEGEIKPPLQRQMRPVQYQGSDKIREQIGVYEAPTSAKKDLKVQIHKGIVDTNTNATIVEDTFVKKTFIPARIKDVKP